MGVGGGWKEGGRHTWHVTEHCKGIHTQTDVVVQVRDNRFGGSMSLWRICFVDFIDFVVVVVVFVFSSSPKVL